MNDEIKTKLLMESELENITLNTLIGKILTKHVEWDNFAEDIGFLYVTRPFVRALLDFADDAEILELAKTACAGAFRDVIIYLHGEFSLENLLDTLKLWLSSSHIPFRITEKDNAIKIIIQHEMGMKWSQYCITLITELLKNLDYTLENSIVTEQNCSFEISK